MDSEYDSDSYKNCEKCEGLKINITNQILNLQHL